GQRFGTHPEVIGLFGCDDADRAPSFEPPVVAQFGGENGGERHQDERNDQRHSALPLPPRAPHPATSISRCTRPQSLNSMVISTASGREANDPVCITVGGGHCDCQTS